MNIFEEATEIIKNAFEAWRKKEISREQYEEVRNNTLLDVGYQLEIISQPNTDIGDD